MKKILLAFLAVIAFSLLATILYFQLSDCGVAPWSCGDYTPRKQWATQKIAVGAGPEDMAVDTSMGYPRIIISCSERRADKKQIGTFYQFRPSDTIAAPMTVLPRNLTIQPHGIDVVTINNIPFLYAVSHDVVGRVKTHRIYRFRINRDALILDNNFTLEHPLLTGPNDIDVLEDGSFYVSNPSPSDEEIESTKAILGVKNGTVLHYDGKGKWTTALKDMCYPNGVLVNQKAGYLMVANGGCQSVEKFPIQNGQVVASEKSSTNVHGIDITVGDNLLMDKAGNVWTTTHPCPLKFLNHAKEETASSPTQVFKVDPNTMKSELVFQTNGELISAASTALYLDNQLFISQVFDPFVLVVDY
ncbi:MAG: SMP-30/gluconolactonase/LRE family protein [Bacteroidota bacterium]